LLGKKSYVVVVVVVVVVGYGFPQWQHDDF